MSRRNGLRPRAARSSPRRASCSPSAGTRASGTEEIVNRAGVTRGALYHHFGDKKDLMRAVLHDLARELAEASAAAALKETDQWQQILAAVGRLPRRVHRPRDPADHDDRRPERARLGRVA